MKNTILLSFALCSLLFDICAAQTQFQRAIGGPSVDVAYGIVRTTDGGYAVAGRTASFGAGSSDFYIVKLDASGIIQWNKTIGGTNLDLAESIIQTTDGGCAVAGYTNSFGAGYYDMYIVKLDGSGTFQWSRTVGGGGIGGGDDAYSIIQTTDGGYAVAGSTNSFGAGAYDMYIVKLDGSGTFQWSRTVGGMYYDYTWSVIQTTDGGYAAAGSTQTFGAGADDMYIVKLDASGTLQWNKTIGGTNNDYAFSIIQTTDGGYAVAGDTRNTGTGVGDMYIVKLDVSGVLQWSRTVGGTNGDHANSIIQATDGGYVVAGETYSFGAGLSDMYIVKLDGSGTLQWSRTIGGTNSDMAYSIIQTADGGYAVAGYTYSFGAGNSDMYIVKLDGSGNTCGNSSSPANTVTTPTSTVTTPTSTVTTPTPTVTTPSSSTGTGGTVTTICVTGIQPISNEIPSSYKLYQNYPNPFNAKSNIKYQITKSSFVELKVLDITARLISVLVEQKQAPGIYEVGFDGNDLSSGIYFYSLTVDGSLIDTKKMILLK